jgi:hypothetical protein
MVAPSIDPQRVFTPVYLDDDPFAVRFNRGRFHDPVTGRPLDQYDESDLSMIESRLARLGVEEGGRENPEIRLTGQPDLH